MRAARLCLSAWLLVAVGGLIAQEAAMPDSAQDRILLRAPVPSRLLRQGEVRLVRRGSNVVVQTVLDTRHLARVIKTIDQKESVNWPAGGVGSVDAAAYRAGLKAAAEVVAGVDEGGTLKPGRHQLCIEFVSGPAVAWVAFLHPVVSEGDGGLEVARAEPIESFDAQPDYVRRNQALILQDNFGEAGVRALEQARR